MNLKHKLDLPVNAFIRTPGKISEIKQNLSDVEDALETNAAVLKYEVAKQRRLMKLKDETLNELKDISKELVDSKNWDELKKSTLVKSSKILNDGRTFVSANSPKIRTTGQFVKKLFARKQPFSTKDIELIKQLADLKQQGILSEKEFAISKKKILARL